MKIDLKKKVVVITGGSGVICSELALGLASQNSKIVLLGRVEDKPGLESTTSKIKKETNNNDIAYYCADATSKESMVDIHNKINKEVGGCDILINGVGGNSPDVTCDAEFCNYDTINDTQSNNFFNLDIQKIKRNLDLNFTSSVICSQIFSKDMIEKKAGSILNISSMAVDSAITRVLTYSAAKAALENFTRWLSVYFAKVNIRVNAIAPGFFIGEQNRKLLLNEDGSYTPRSEKIIRNTPYGRFGEVNELLTSVYFLLDDDSKFITGVTIPVDGGFSVFSGV